MDTIFKLTGIEYCDEHPQYPSFEVFRNTIGYFSNLDNAVQKMKHCTSSHPFGFLIDEYELDGEWEMTTESRRSYLPDGSPLDENLLSETPRNYTPETFPNSEKFLGRPADKVRFQTCDLVETLHGDKVTLEIVTAIPLSPEKVDEFQERSKKEPGIRFPFYSEDDSYRTVSHDGICWDNNVVDVFPARFQVNDELHRQLRKAFLLEYIRKTARQKLFFIKDIDDICQKLKFVS